MWTAKTSVAEKNLIPSLELSRSLSSGVPTGSDIIVPLQTSLSCTSASCYILCCSINCTVSMAARRDEVEELKTHLMSGNLPVKLQRQSELPSLKQWSSWK